MPDKYAKFRALWEEAGRRNQSFRAYAEDHGEKWFCTREEADALRIKLHAARVVEEARRAFVREFAPHFDVYTYDGAGNVRRVAGPDYRRYGVGSPERIAPQ